MWLHLKEQASDFPLWSQELRNQRLQHENETTIERNTRITAFLDSELHHNASPLWHHYLFIHILVHWLSAVFVIIKDGLNPVNSASAGISRPTLQPIGFVPYTQLFSTPPMMVFVFLWVSYLSKVYVWGNATVVVSFAATVAVIVTAYPWWDGGLVRTIWSYTWPNYMVGLLAFLYLFLGLPLWYGISSCVHLVRHGITNIGEEVGCKESRSDGELPKNNQRDVFL